MKIKTLALPVVLLVLLAGGGKVVVGGQLSSVSSWFSSEREAAPGKVLAATDSQIADDLQFQVNIPATFNNVVFVNDRLVTSNLVTSSLDVEELISDQVRITGTLTAPNVVYSLAVSGDGLEISGDQELLISNTDRGSDQNIFKNFKVGGDTISAGSNTDTIELVAGDSIGISLDTSNKKITVSNTLSTPWTSSGSNVYLSTSTQSVGIGTSSPSYKLHVAGTGYISSTLTVDGDTFLNGNVTLGDSTSDNLTVTGQLTSGTAILPDVDLGADLGSASLRFNNIYVANLNSNSGLSTAGQSIFTYEPTSSAYTQASVMINPTSPAANGLLLGVGVAGYERAGIDEDGDLTLGYNNGVSAPESDYPLNIYGHSGTRVAYIDENGNANFSGTVTFGGVTGNYTQGSLIFAGSGGALTQDNSNLFWDDTNNRLGIGTTSPASTLHVAGTIKGTSQVILPNGSLIAPSLVLDEATNTGISASSTSMTFGRDNSWAHRFSASGYNTGGPIIFNSTGVLNGVNDLYLYRDAANTLALRNGTNAQGQRIYNTYTNSSNYERLAIQFSSNVAEFRTEALGTGTARNIALMGGNVGIGTTNPTQALTVNGKIITDYSSTGPASNGIYAWGSDQPGNYLYAGLVGGTPGADAASSYVKFGAYQNSSFAEQSYIALTKGGSVGIGTTNPQRTLDVNGYVKAQGLYSSDGNINKYISTTGNNFTYSTFGQHSFRTYNGVTETYSEVLKIAGGVGLNDQNLIFSGNGNVGIGTTSPLSKLHVEGATTGKALAMFNETGNQNILTASASGTTRMVLTNAGRLGVGTTSPSDPLHVIGNIRTSGGIYSSTWGMPWINGTDSSAHATNYVWFGNAGDPDFPVAAVNTAGSSVSSLGVLKPQFTFSSDRNTGMYWTGVDSLGFTVGGVHALGIDSSGNVGIGTTSPLSKLHVEGATTGKALAMFNETGNQNILTASASGTTRMVLTNAGSLGIGTTTPGAVMEIFDSQAYSASTKAFLLKLPNLPGGQSSEAVTVRSDATIKITDRYGDITDAGVHITYLNSQANPAIYVGRNFSNLPTVAGGAFSNESTGTSDWDATSINFGVGGYSNGTNSGVDAAVYGLARYTSNNYSSATATTYGGYFRAITTSGYDNGTTAKSYIGTRAIANPVFGNNANSTSIGLWASASGSETNYAALFEGGNVGIGTTTPGALLDVSTGASDPSFTFLARFGGGNGTIGHKYQIGFGKNGVTNPSSIIGAESMSGSSNGYTDLFFSTRTAVTDTLPTERLRITGGGNVGIGTSNPGAKLDVSGGYILADNQQGYRIEDTSGTDLWSLYAGNDNILQIGSGSWAGTKITSGSGFLQFLGGASGTTEVARITNGGNVGIGTTNPNGLFHVEGGAGNAYFKDTTTTTGFTLNVQSTGTAAPSRLRVGGTGTYWEMYATDNGGGSGAYLLYNRPNPNAIQIGSNVNNAVTNVQLGAFNSNAGSTAGVALVTKGTNRLLIDSSGNVGIGTTTPTTLLDLESAAPTLSINASTDGNDASIVLQEAATTKWSIFNDGDDSDTFYITDAEGDQGVSLAQGATSWAAASDITLKDNVKLVEGSLDKVKQLNGYYYNFIGGSRTEVGLVAQEVQTVLPELVVQNKNGKLAVMYDRLAPVLVNAIKEQQVQIDSLGNLTTIETRLAAAETQAQENKTGLAALQQVVADLFKNSATFLADLTVKGRIWLSPDQTGTLTIPAGKTTATITFSEELPVTPVVHLTPQDASVSGWKLKEVTPQHFIIELNQAAASDVSFNWLAVLKDSANPKQPQVTFDGQAVLPAPSASPQPTPTPAVSPSPLVSPSPVVSGAQTEATNSGNLNQEGDL